VKIFTKFLHTQKTVHSFFCTNKKKNRILKRIYFQDEVVAVKDAESPRSRIVIRAEDFSTWLVNDRWNWGLMASYHEKPSTKMMKPSNGIPITSLLSNTKIDLSDVEKEKGSIKLFFRFIFISLVYF
jgi:hypothetical protein